MSSSSEESDSDSSVELETLDISNDCYYKTTTKCHPENYYNPAAQLDIPEYGSKTIRHSLPAYDLWLPFYPTRLKDRLRNFHRPKLRHFRSGPQALSRCVQQDDLRFPIKNLAKSIIRHQKLVRSKVIRAINHGFSRDWIVNNCLLIYKASDLTAKNGEIFLFEYCEEFPLVLNQVGMAANLRTYHFNDTATLTKSNNINASAALKMGYEKQVRADIKPQIYFDKPKIGSRTLMIETNLTRAPIFEHNVPSTDFLVIRTRNSFYIRPVNDKIYTVGQLMPLVLIPDPSDTNINKFRREFSDLYIHRMLLTSDPPSFYLEDILKYFDDYSRHNMLRRLKVRGFSYCQATTTIYPGSAEWADLPLGELRKSFTPEKYCLNMTMLAARERLRDLNYTESMIHSIGIKELEHEVLAAPWNVSKAIQQAYAQNSRCYLDLKEHLIDPSGPAREGFSCVAWSKSPLEDEILKEQKVFKRKEAPFDFKNPHMMKIRQEKLSRMSTFHNEAQMIAKVQATSLSSDQVMSSDEGENSDTDMEEEEEDENLNTSLDDQAEDLDKLICGQTVEELNFEKEEEERKMLVDMINQSEVKQESPKIPAASLKQILKNRFLLITRLYRSEEGPIQRSEIVRDPKIISLYLQQKGDDINKYMKTSFDDSPSNLTFNDSFRLGPHELSRTEGTTITISKQVIKSKTNANGSMRITRSQAC